MEVSGEALRFTSGEAGRGSKEEIVKRERERERESTAQVIQQSLFAWKSPLLCQPIRVACLILDWHQLNLRRELQVEAVRVVA